MAAPNLTVRMGEEDKELVENTAKAIFPRGKSSDLIKAFVDTLRSKPIREVRNFIQPSLEGDVEYSPSAITLYKFDASAPCGDWAAVANSLSPYEVTAEMADLLGAYEGDWVVPCAGTSMVGADIPDGAVLVMRPLRSENGTREAEHNDICLVQIICSDGDCLWTVKRWRWNGNQVVLENGQRQEMALPKNAYEIHAIAVKVATIAHGRK